MKQNRKQNKVSSKRKIYKITNAATLIYSSVGIALYHLQKKLLFHPVTLPWDYKFSFNIPFKEVNIAMNDTDTLNLIQFSPDDAKAKGVVIYFHGNSGNVTNYAKCATDFLKHGYEVWMPDYPGYGKTTGDLTEENMYKQAKEVYKLAHSKFAADRIIVYGRSLGSGIASYIAAKFPCRRLILETPYYSMPDLLSTYVLIYPTRRILYFKFPVGEYLYQIIAPVSIFHGTSDKVIPYRCAAKLKKVLKPGDEFITIENGGHNNLSNFEIFHQNLDSVLSL